MDVVTLLDEAKLWSMEGMEEVELAEDMPVAAMAVSRIEEDDFSSATASPLEPGEEFTPPMAESVWSDNELGRRKWGNDELESASDNMHP